jgi:hypothetical protein
MLARAIRPTQLSLWILYDFLPYELFTDFFAASYAAWPDDAVSRCTVMLAFAMVVLGLATFAAMWGFVKLCDRV